MWHLAEKKDAGRLIQRISGATRHAAMTLTDDELGAVRWRDLVFENGAMVEPAVEEVLAGVKNVMAHLEVSFSPGASVRRGHNLSVIKPANPQVAVREPHRRQHRALPWLHKAPS